MHFFFILTLILSTNSCREITNHFCVQETESKVLNLSKKNLLILGAPGTGKGTQSKFIVEKYSLKHISLGEILRKEVQKKTKIGGLIESYINEGRIVPIDISNQILDTKLSTENTEGYIFDGYPRNITQAKALDSLFSKNNLQISCILNLQMKDSLLIERLLERAKTSNRADDQSIEIIENRLRVYKNEIDETLSFYTDKVEIFNIKAELSISEINLQIEEIIKNL